MGLTKLVAGATTTYRRDARITAKARLTVAANSADVEECRLFLDMLGLLDDE